MKADVWALGVIMYIFITGKMPFDETKVCSSLSLLSIQVDFTIADMFS